MEFNENRFNRLIQLGYIYMKDDIYKAMDSYDIARKLKETRGWSKERCYEASIRIEQESLDLIDAYYRELAYMELKKSSKPKMDKKEYIFKLIEKGYSDVDAEEKADSIYNNKYKFTKI